MFEDNYFQDEHEIHEAVNDADTHIIFKKELKGLKFEEDEEYDFEEIEEQPDVELALVKIFHNLKNYTDTYVVPLLDKCDYSDFYNWLEHK